MKKQRAKTKGAFGSSLNNHVLHDLRRKLANNQVIILALVDHFKLGQPQMDGIIRDFMQRQYSTLGYGGVVKQPETAPTDSC